MAGVPPCFAATPVHRIAENGINESIFCEGDLDRPSRLRCLVRQKDRYIDTAASTSQLQTYAMNSSIDFLKFQKVSGSLKWLPMVGAAFIRQLPQWRKDLEDSLLAQDHRLQMELLHKIKGSCYAVAAYNAADIVIQIEVMEARGEPLGLSALLSELERVEVELLTIVASVQASSSQS
jgi:hypothetical protein